MGDSRSTKKSSGEMENLALDANRFSRDLLQRFMGVSSGGGGGDGSETVEDDGELELNLGLSLGGRFGVDKSSNKLLRSSSIAACLPIVRDDDAVATPAAAAAYSALVRTSSLPVETEEEWRKRKELQTMRRLEAKRRRSEKQRISRGDAGAGAGGSNVDEPKREIGVNFRTRLDKEQLLAATKSSFRSGIDIGMFKGKRSCFSSNNKMQPSSQGSIESQGANSSSMSELECKSLQGSCELSPGSIQSIQEGGNQETGSSRAKTTQDHPSRTASGIETDPPPNKPESTSRQATREAGTGTGSLEDMPCVFTKGDGPNGKRIDGILYKYGKGEEVRIMCVCHGSFLSPAEFVKHAGGSDVAHPLKHIVINRNSSPFQ
ncbi:PREDICTED: ninja-family protein AFP2 isoform X2 [Ipomoea nil]|uniref:ninja-family protein AFP2 isoform X2 n=1 Tax=Ipomoea nil TaxID=35883 RepID=UPI000900E333|nr:PREDICTED: ninja-family protein AFP2 isoform X2 [Ipomoea nil]